MIRNIYHTGYLMFNIIDALLYVHFEAKELKVVTV